MNLKSLLVSLFIILLSGCSTLIARQNNLEEVSFESNAPNAEVDCSGKVTKIPGTLALIQSKNHTCTAEAAGFQRKTFTIHSGVSWSGFLHSTALNTASTGWWTLGIGTGAGWVMDLGSGAMKNLKENYIYIEMTPTAVLS